MSQMSFEWPVQVSYAPEDFIVSEANAEAACFLERWPDDTAHVALLCGPPASGKTHLAHLWAQRTGALFMDSAKLGTCPSADLWGDCPYAVAEDIDQLQNETALFHFLRHAETQPLHLLLTSAAPAFELHFTLPDLRSRLRSYPTVTLNAPDAMLLRAYLVKCFSDYQQQVGEDVLSFLLLRLGRSFQALRDAAQNLARKSSDSKRPITIPWINSLKIF